MLTKCFEILRNWCYCPHTSRDSMSPVCRIFPLQRTMHRVYFPVCSLQCVVCSAVCMPCAVYSVQCSVHAVCSVQYSVQCAVCSLQCACSDPWGNSCRIGAVRHPGTYFFWIFSLSLYVWFRAKLLKLHGLFVH